VRWLLALYAVVFVLIVAPSYLTPLMIVRTFGSEVWKLTVNEVAFSVGMVLGGALLATWGGLKNRGTMIVASTLVFGVLSVGLGLSTHLVVFFAFMLGHPAASRRRDRRRDGRRCGHASRVDVMDQRRLTSGCHRRSSSGCGSDRRGAWWRGR